MVHRNTAKSCGIGLAILTGVMLLALPIGGASAADPAVNITCTTAPDAPTDMEITQTGVATANITWTKGLGANITIIRVATSGYPFSIFDGSSTYSGNGTWVEVTGLDLENNTYYYRAWSQNNYGTSTGYDQVSIGSGAGTTSVDVSALITYLDDLFGGPMGIGNIIIIGFFLVIAVWKKGWIRIIMSLGVVTWGAFALDYDAKIAAPLIAVGTILFFEAIIKTIQQRRAEAAQEA